MGKKRIIKKRLKKKLIEVILSFDAGEPLRKRAWTEKRMYKMTMPELIDFSQQVAKALALWSTPLRPMVPRMPVHIDVPWRTPVEVGR